MVIGIVSFVAKNNNVITPIRTFNNIANVISYPDLFKDKVNTVFDTVKTIDGFKAEVALTKGVDEVKTLFRGDRS